MSKTRCFAAHGKQQALREAPSAFSHRFSAEEPREKICKNEVQSHYVIENTRSRFGSKPKGQWMVDSGEKEEVRTKLECALE